MSSQTLPETFRLRAGNFNLLVLRLLDPRPEVVLPVLGDQFRRAPGFLRFAPIVIGLGDLMAAPEEVDFRGLIEGLRALEIVPVGTTGGSPPMRQAATAAGLPPLRAAGGREAEQDVPLAAPSPAASAAPEPPVPAPPAAAPAAVTGGRSALVVTEPVRAGQRIYAEGADIIVTATVNPGGEVIADGHVHVYGALRGRAIAGARNDAEARIFALNFDPELIAIAGYYAVREGLGEAPIGRPVQVRLEGEEMRFGPLG
ncbi:septum site-determining protein MinC [Paracraurococcus lichenis]|uniref:Probable septum site-determining protein MinC n=1 Tax=Paracraurococcus lichenis TaxID=3064888 RepID=A0ABT9E791_9PROT|nr:septum site-determining protein MinC [Paracraurococcus sp. LOR1-02]MDO9712056.1 septum site-determining protein MinC [Paracraurococcus sp. LOR1-02]